MNHKTTLKEIKAKFGTIARFSDLAGLDYAELKKTLARFNKGMSIEKEKELRKIHILSMKTDPNKQSSKEITSQEMTCLVIEVGARGGALKVAKAMNFNFKSLCDIMSGRRKMKTKKIQELFTTLNVK